MPVACCMFRTQTDLTGAPLRRVLYRFPIRLSLFSSPSSSPPAMLSLLPSLLLGLSLFHTPSVNALGTSCSAALGAGTAAASDPYWSVFPDSPPPLLRFWNLLDGTLGTTRLLILVAPPTPQVAMLFIATSWITARREMGRPTIRLRSTPPFLVGLFSCNLYFD